MQDALKQCRVGVIGLGLMGGSLALTLKDACRSIGGYDVDPAVIAQALERGIIQRPLDLRGDEVDLLILAAPVSAILDWLDHIPAVFSGEFPPARSRLDQGANCRGVCRRCQIVSVRSADIRCAARRPQA
jgi:hypothetical protein